MRGIFSLNYERIKIEGKLKNIFEIDKKSLPDGNIYFNDIDEKKIIGNVEQLNTYTVDSLDENRNPIEYKIREIIDYEFIIGKNYLLCEGKKDYLDLLISQLGIITKDNITIYDDPFPIIDFLKYCENNFDDIIINKLELSNVNFKNCGAKVTLDIDNEEIGKNILNEFNNSINYVTIKLLDDNRSLSCKVSSNGNVILYSRPSFIPNVFVDFLNSR